MQNMEDEDEFVRILRDPNTTVEWVKAEYHKYPKLNGHMVEDVARYGSPIRFDILRVLADANWFRMAGRSIYESFVLVKYFVEGE